MSHEKEHWMQNSKLEASKLIAEFDEFINDDFNTAKVLANMFELVPSSIP